MFVCLRVFIQACFWKYVSSHSSHLICVVASIQAFVSESLKVIIAPTSFVWLQIFRYLFLSSHRSHLIFISHTELRQSSNNQVSSQIVPAHFPFPVGRINFAFFLDALVFQYLPVLFLVHYLVLSKAHVTHRERQTNQT